MLSENPIGEIARELERKARELFDGKAKTKKKIGYDFKQLRRVESKIGRREKEELGKIENTIRKYEGLIKRKRTAWKKRT